MNNEIPAVTEAAPVPERDSSVTMIYINCIEVAKAEYDSIEAELMRLQTRARHLKMAIGALSNLIGVYEDLEDKYTFMPKVYESKPAKRPNFGKARK